MAQRVLDELERAGGSAYVWELERSLNVSPEDLGRALWSLREGGLVTLKPGAGASFAAYLLGPPGWWFWLYVLGVGFGAVAALAVPNSPPQVELLRVLMGAPTLFYLPGYAIWKALFPERRWGSLEEAAASIALSLSVDPLIGLGLVQSPPGMTVITTTLSFASLEVALGLTAAYRRYEVERGGLVSAGRRASF